MTIALQYFVQLRRANSDATVQTVRAAHCQAEIEKLPGAAGGATVHVANDSRSARTERRASMRFSLQAPVLFSWFETGQPKQSAGFTRDMGTAGAFVTCEPGCEIELGTEVAIEVLLPPVQGTSAPARLYGKGRVVRRSGPDERLGFALLTEFGLVSRVA